MKVITESTILPEKVDFFQKTLTSFKVERMMEQIIVLCAQRSHPLERHNGVKDDPRGIGISLGSPTFGDVFLESRELV